MSKPKVRRPTIDVNPKKGTTRPPGKVRVDPKSRHGFVTFNATAPCTLLFKNHRVFDHHSARLKKGLNKRVVQIERGHTLVFIKGSNMAKGVGAATNPTDIIVP